MSEIRTMVRREMDTFKVERLSEDGWRITWQPSGLDLVLDTALLEAKYMDLDQWRVLALVVVCAVKLMAPPVLAEVRTWLESLSSYDIVFTSWPAKRIAQENMTPERECIPIGAGYAGLGGNATIASITYWRDGTLRWQKVRVAK